MEFINGLFQAFAVRAGGFYIVPLSSVRISLQVLYVIMMYISAYPVAITIRNSNVYEERSLGVYASESQADSDSDSRYPQPFHWLHSRFVSPGQDTRTKLYFVQQQLHAQLAHDLWWLVLAIFLIMVIESTQFESNPTVFSVFNVIFEVVSGKFSSIYHFKKWML
jgi:Trk-type K+ transport system membrane component